MVTIMGTQPLKQTCELLKITTNSYRSRTLWSHKRNLYYDKKAVRHHIIKHFNYKTLVSRQQKLQCVWTAAFVWLFFFYYNQFIYSYSAESVFCWVNSSGARRKLLRQLMLRSGSLARQYAAWLWNSHTLWSELHTHSPPWFNTGNPWHQSAYSW